MCVLFAHIPLSSISPPRLHRADRQLTCLPDPDNYTDQSTFLEKLQLNPRLQPYEFWPLVADSTVIVQHVCSVIIFIVCFVGIFQERMSPVSVVGWGSFATFLGWLLCDWWITKEAKSNPDAGIAWSRSRSGGRAYRDFGPSGTRESGPGAAAVPNPSLTSFSSLSNLPSAASSTSNLLAPHESVASHSRFSLAGHAAGTNHLSLPEHGRSVSASSFQSTTSAHNATAMPATTASRDGSVGARVVGRPDTMPEPNYPSTPLASPTGNTNGHSTRLTGLHDGRLPPRPQTTSMRFGTIKSAVLIYFTLLGLSPILKSLTRSTSSDSIWAMSFWLLAINIFFFDYSGGNTGGPSQASAASSSTTVGPATTSTTTTTANTRTTLLSGSKFPVASLSTNAAVMASTVLASRLPSTGQVFSLTLFSIEVFGLFPVFRRWARHASWCYHVALTILLVLGAGAGVGVIVGGGAGGADAARRERRENAGMAEADWAWIWAAERAAIGMLGACLIAALAMGGCSWWLIGLQKYKNEIYGPWDPARPIIMSRRHWDFDG